MPKGNDDWSLQYLIPDLRGVEISYIHFNLRGIILLHYATKSFCYDRFSRAKYVLVE